MINNARQYALEQLQALFPGVVNDGMVDYARLKAELGEPEEVGEEKYGLTWAGKQVAKKLAGEDVVGRTLRYAPEESKNPESTQNLFIEGDNLEVLKLLRRNYYAAIKMIYIDPPYNKGKDFVYRDIFTQAEMESEWAEGNIDEDGERLVRNQRSSNRFHARWLDMIYPRLRIARDLLAEDGMIFISIDDDEIANLRKVCDEIFGEMNFMSQIVIRANSRGQTYNQIAKTHEYLLLYAKNVDSCELFELEKDAEKDDLHFADEIGAFNVRELRNRNPKFGRDNRPNLFYEIFVDPTQPDQDGFYPVAVTPKAGYSVSVTPLNSQGRESCWRWGREKAEANIKETTRRSDLVAKAKQGGGFMIVEKYRKTTYKPKSIWDHNSFLNETGTTEVKKLGIGESFTFPKPVGLIEHCLGLATSGDDLVLDFFAGSGTTAHAVMRKNAGDGGNRKFILVQIAEKTAPNSEAFKAGFKTLSAITKKRIDLAGNQVEAEQVGRAALDIGFKVFKTDDTMIRWTHAAVHDDKTLFDEATLSDKEKLDFMPHFTDVDVAYEILLRQHDVPLSAEMEQLTNIGKRVWRFAGRYVICLEERVTSKLIEKLAAIEPTPFKYVFRDSAFGDDIVLKDETIRRLTANIGRKKKICAVEFL